MKNKRNSIIFFLASFTILTSCKKYLDAKSDQSLVVISTVQDLQSLLDNDLTVNGMNPNADAASSDDYYVSYASFQSFSYEQFRNLYTWQPTNVFNPYTNVTNDWTQLYNTVYIANVVLDNLDKIVKTESNASAWDNVKGQAQFLRAYAFLKAASIWSLAYDDRTSESDLGIPLRLTSDFNIPSVRSTVAETYNQIVTDANAAVRLLPNTSVHSQRSCKPAAYALMAKAYLAMRQYNKAGLYADSCLKIYNTLVDFNTFNTASAYPITQFNKEVIYNTYNGGAGGQLTNITNAKIDTVLYRLYASNDLRKTLYFKVNADGSMAFRGSYYGTAQLFSGIATDEVYLIRAECHARATNISAAMGDLNTILIKRYKTGAFIPLTASDPSDALSKILLERQKELVMRGTRWMDIKRLNKEGYGISLKRILNGQTYILPANDLRFALALPDDIITLSGMQQNPR
ncbi:RagB/SusD family nutrient uptake outer membrane protein [Flavobacterium sp. Sd200]|uniref:RagB/SusD family nutrient uptake outer membrane protein n=1 Tax=Flavobacterium sp. Sd200 TaxID=2692211 RepID=UPI00136D5CF1|nr:RagB/SusD family nutrient uptake outer membrane protein [Flavobacterium sp. Sd200]MXN91144.1 RagB/SusD family nutrient uptake outer membrane protein [Flavobacterium sp. Sd200]